MKLVLISPAAGWRRGDTARRLSFFYAIAESGLFDKAGFKRLHVAGHPEGNKDIDPDGSDANVMEALRWKQQFNDTTDAEMALATQFAFEADPIIAWADALKEAGITIPIHIGIAGPAKLQTLINLRLLVVWGHR